ncbi:MAG: hypothetical protein HY293_01520 [Planctomycetes bacterium]|nr:hypothetical protein [Planctomycetota bacterium]
MRQGMDRGKPSPDRKGTSRVSKPATGRMNAQGSGTSRRERGGEAQQERGVPAAPPADNKNTLYIGIGGGALVFVLILAFMISGGDSEARSAGGAESMMKSAINRSQEAYQRGEYRQALDIAEEALKDPRSRKSSRYNALNSLATMARTQVNLDRDAQVKVAEFKKKVDAAVADQTAMAKANGFWQECNVLMGSYGATTSAKQLKDIKEDLRRWVATEGQGDWQKDYNVTKARIEKSFLGDQRFGEAIREWQRFGEISQDPLLRSRIEQEIRTVNQLAQAAAEKVVADAAGDRTKLEEAQSKFNGTDGQAVINKAMRSIK